MNSISIPALTHRLSLAPIEAYENPQVVVHGQAVGEIDVCACVNDVHRDLFGRYLEANELSAFRLESTNENKNYLSLVAICCHVASFVGLRAEEHVSEQFLSWLEGDLRSLAALARARDFVSEDDRREEIVRKVLLALDLLPEGETFETASDRLSAIDSVLRHRVVEESRRVQERMRLLREEMARKEAEEAASKMSRE